MIHIIIYKLIELRIAPLVWHIVPVWWTDAGLGNTSKDIFIKLPSGRSDSEIPRIKSVKIKYEVGFIGRWLCFTFQCTYMKKSEHIAKIYSDNYNCQTDPKWLEKYEQLCATDYFQ